MRWPTSPRPSNRGRLLAALAVLLTLLYPLLIYLGLGRVEPRWLALLLAALAVLRALSSARPWWWAAAAGAGLLAGLSMLGNSLLPLKLYPPLVSLVLLGVFAASLLFPPPLVERIARLQEPDLPAHAVRYTRRVTEVWCGFFVINGGISLLTALYASEALWALYNGLVSYLLIGLLFAAEWLVRQRVRAAHG
jgi:uncharacterized membrane protein